MALFFSGAVTSSPIKRRSRSSHTCHSLDVSLLSPDSSYVCYSSLDGGDSSCCRRSPRLLTNGYYEVTEDSFSWDEQGNVSLTPCKTSVSYKENLVRVFRRRRRPRNSLVRLISDVTESCQSWLDEKVFRGVFRTGQNQDQEQDQDQNQEQDQDQDQDQDHNHNHNQNQNQSQDHDLDLDLDLDLDRTIRSHAGPVLLDRSSWSGLKSTELEENCCFTYDPTEAPPPPDKLAPPPPDKLAPPPIMREEICSEICESKERFTQSLGGLSEVLPPSPFYSNTCCCQASPEDPGFSMKTLLLLGFTVFIFTALVSGSLWWSSSVTSTMFLMVTAFMVVTKSGPMGEWRKAKTEDITSRNE